MATLPVQSIGGNGGWLKEKRFDGQRLTGIQLWAENKDNQKIRGLRIWMKSGYNEVPVTYGTVVGTASARFTVAVTETVTSLQLWDNGSKEVNGTRLGTIEIKLNTGRTFKFGINKTQQSPKTVQATVGSGIIVGYKVRSSLDIDALGFEFLRPVQSSEITDVKFPGIGNLGTLPPTNLDTFSQTNNTSSPTTWTFKGSQKKVVSSEWSFDLALIVGASVTATAGIPKLAAVEAQFQWEVSAAFHQSIRSSIEREITWNSGGVVPPNDKVTAIAISGHGTIDINYTANMKITTQGGYVISYPFEGRYKGVDWTEAHVTINEGHDAKIYSYLSDRIITGLEDYGAADDAADISMTE